jgi:sugar lactone lactonase YvrE
MAVDTAGRRYLATPMGIQVFDQLGRCHLILALPPGVDWVSNVAFGGPKLDTLYITCMNRVFKRRIGATGVHTWQAPIQPPRPGL